MMLLMSCLAFHGLPLNYYSKEAINCFFCRVPCSSVNWWWLCAHRKRVRRKKASHVQKISFHWPKPVKVNKMTRFSLHPVFSQRHKITLWHYFEIMPKTNTKTGQLHKSWQWTRPGFKTKLWTPLLYSYCSLVGIR